MNNPLLVDTSVWIDFFRNKTNQQVETLTEYLENDHPVLLCPVILQEILQGVRNDNQFEQVKKDLMAFDILIADPLDAAIGAARLYRNLRKMGITIRKSNDCLIAYYSIRYSVEILYNDRDFELMYKKLHFISPDEKEQLIR